MLSNVMEILVCLHNYNFIDKINCYMYIKCTIKFCKAGLNFDEYQIELRLIVNRYKIVLSEQIGMSSYKPTDAMHFT